MEYDAINLGTRDFCFGQRFLTELQRNYRIPLISANIRYKNTRRLFAEPYVIKKFNCKSFLGIPYDCLEIGIFGLTEAPPVSGPDSTEQELEIETPLESAKSLMRVLGKKCDFVILLAQLDMKQCTEIARDVEGIDIIVASARKGNEMQVDQTLIIRSGLQGKYVADVKISLNEDKEIAEKDCKLVPLDKKIKEDSTVVELITEYLKSTKLKKYYPAGQKPK